MWEWLKDSRDDVALKRFVAQFPGSARRADAEQRIAALAAAAAVTAPPTRVPFVDPQIDPRELARSVQLELTRVGCFSGAVNGEVSGATRAGLRDFIKYSSIKLRDDELTPETLKALRGVDKRVCPLVCPGSEHAEGDRCIATVCRVGQVLKNGTCQALPAPPPRQIAVRHPEEREPAPKRKNLRQAATPRPIEGGTQHAIENAKAADRHEGTAGQITCGIRGCIPVPKGCRVRSHTTPVPTAFGELDCN
jgi:hypothetical protein